MPRKTRRLSVSPNQRTKTAGNWIPIGIAAGLTIAVLMVYWRVTGYQFIDFDDDAYILDNPPVRAGLTESGIAWAFTSVRHFYWQPLTWLSHMLDCQVYGLNAGGHHFTNVLFHCANAVILFFLLRRMTGHLYRSGFVAALFALHPLRVESVAWIAERKDVLSGFFCLLTLYTYLRYAERKSAKRYLAVVAAFACALMAKPMAVTLPVVLLLLDYWPLRRTESPGSRIREKVPLFLMSCVVGGITFVGQQEMGALASLEGISFPARLGNAVVGYAEYLWKTVWPANLAILYPWHAQRLFTRVLPALALLIAISVLVVTERRRRPWLLIGWCWFVVVMAPTSGIFQAGSQAFADRFTYLPHIGLLIAVVWTAAELLSRWKRGGAAGIVLALTILPVLGIASWTQTRHWADSITVAEHAIEVTGENAVMEHDLAHAFAEQGRRSEAISHFSRSIAIEPGHYATQYGLAKALLEDGRSAEAEAHFRESIRLKPDYAEAHFGLGEVLQKRDAQDEAAHEFGLALAGHPDSPFAADAHNNLGVILAKQGRFEEAASHFAEAVRLKPELIGAHMNYAQCLVAENRRKEAVEYLSGVLRTSGENSDLRAFLNRLTTTVR